MSWSFYDCWNDSLEERKVRHYSPRNHIWASEMGGAMVDRYLKMMGETPTNPPNSRALRKFEAGNIWEWIVGIVLKKAGVFIDEQEWVEYRYPNLLNVTGKLDFMAGGNPDWEKAWAEVEDEHYPDFITKAARGVIENLQVSYPEGMKLIILEVKSCSSFMFDRYLKSMTGNPNHRLQAFHYLKAKKMDEAHIVYICKDDARMLELGVLNPSEVENEYKADIGAMTNYIKNKQEPDKEPMIVLDEDFKRFSANWKVEYSSYLTKLYGFKEADEFQAKYKPIISRWNRVIGRILTDKKMTDNNKAAIEEITIMFPDFQKSVERMKEKK